ncbi:hypothetical protein STRDD10_00990 [Streptococcus sp. DD10]|nr:hypothetical protein STRDD10_00990 [Streptococcus sp. DD10]
MPFPTLLLCGSKDKPNLTASRKLSQLIPEAHLRIIENGTHTLNTDFPDSFADEIQQFLENL